MSNRFESLFSKGSHITPARVARFASVTAIRKGHVLDWSMLKDGIHPSRNVQRILSDLHEKADPDEAKPWELVFDHLYPIGDKIFLLANKRVHADMWMRDYVYTSEFMDNSGLDDNILRTFEERQKPSGQINTAIGLIGETPWHFADDESTMLYLIKVAQLQNTDPSKITPQRLRHVKEALKFVKSHERGDGKYHSKAGERRGWLDALIYPQEDVITQNQGIYAVTLMAARKLGLDIKEEEIDLASKNYASMAVNEYLPLSENFSQATDVSVLYPEYLAMTLFDRPLLSKELVLETIKRIPKSENGLVVLSKSPITDTSVNPEYFEPSDFVAKYDKGQYQNGGVWLLWENIAYGVAQMHGLIGSEYREYIKSQLDRSKFAESIRTGGIFEEVFTFERPDQTWNAAIFGQYKIIDGYLKSQNKSTSKN